MRRTLAALEERIAELEAQLARAEIDNEALRADRDALMLHNTHAVAATAKLKVENDALRARYIGGGAVLISNAKGKP